MRYHRYTCASLLVLFVAATHTIADDQASNRVYVKSGHYGQCYAKAVPAEDYGSKGETRIYAVGDKVDRLVETYPWYAQQIDLQNTIWGISVVRIAPVRRGQKPDENDLAIGFYLSGKTIKEYSTLDMSRIENDPGTVWSYFGILKVNGYRWIRSNDYAFDVETGNGKTHSFDVRTGALLASGKSLFLLDGAAEPQSILDNRPDIQHTCLKG